MPDEPKPPPANTPREKPGTRRERGVATREKPKVERPPRFKVLLYNDDYTPMEFVVRLLETVFAKSPSEATALMLQIHRSGAGVGGVYVLEIAETKVAQAMAFARDNQHPLMGTLEPA